MKRVDEMMTIGQFADATGLSVSALRFYAARDLLPPASVDRNSGYRRYEAAQVADGRLIRDLRRLDMSLSDIRHALTRSEAGRRQLVEAHLRQLESMVTDVRNVAQTLGVAGPVKDTAMPTTPTSIDPVVILDAPDLVAALRQVLPAASGDPELPHFMGVLVEGKDGSLRIASTDRHRLAIRDLVPTALHDDFRVVVPAASLQRWLTSLDSIRSDISFSVADDVVTAVGADQPLVANVMPIPFPDLEPLLTPADRAATAVVVAEELLDQLSGFDGHDPVTMSVSDSGITIVRGDHSVAVAAETTGRSPDVALDPVYASDAAGGAVGSEVVIEISDEAQAVWFRSADDGTFTSLVMPVLLD